MDGYASTVIVAVVTEAAQLPLLVTVHFMVIVPTPLNVTEGLATVALVEKVAVAVPVKVL
jgi:hypothetical protein